MRAFLKKVVLGVVSVVGLCVCAEKSVVQENLLHRWSFNGSLADACGGNTAKIDGGATWNDAVHPTGVTLPGGNKYGTGAIDLGYDCGTTGNELTLEIWGTQHALNYYSRLVDWGLDGANYFVMTWSKETSLATDDVVVLWTNATLFHPLGTLAPYALNVPYHISLRLVQRANGGFDACWQKRDAATGALLASGSAGTDALCPLSKLNDWSLWLGRSHNVTTDQDAAATYDEVRIWKTALTDEQLAWSARLGPDALPCDTPVPHTVSVSVEGNGTISLNGGAPATTASTTAAPDASISLVATPAAGALFARWTGNTERITSGAVTDASVTLDAAQDGTLVAEFISDTVPVTATWTGSAANGHLADPANWDCRNHAGTPIAGAVPTTATDIRIAGTTDFSCPVGATLAYKSLTVETCTLTGDCDWRGLGAFTIDGTVNLDGHTLQVKRLDGAGSIFSLFAVDTSEPVPALVTDQACFWLDAADATTIVYTNTNEVLTWTSKDAHHVVATSTNSAARPVDGSVRWGLPTVDFNTLGSGCDLTYPRFTNLRTVFWVTKMVAANRCFLLGDKNNGQGAYNFHRGDSMAYGNANHARFDEVWNRTNVVNWRTDALTDQAFQVVTATMSVDASSDSLTADRNFTDRTGGRQLSELICFSTVLSAVDRTNVVRYLERKWLDATRAPGTVVLEVEDGASVSPTVTLSGNLKFVKKGAGTLAATMGHTYFGDTDLLDGLTVAARSGATGLFGGYPWIGSCVTGTVTVGASAVLDVHGQGGFTTLPVTLAGGTVINTGANYDGTGPFGVLKQTASSTFDCTQGAGVGFYYNLVDLGGQTLDILTSDQSSGFSTFHNNWDSLTEGFTNGTVHVRGDGEFKIWSSMNARTVDFDIDCPLWMCWTTTVHNLTYRYTRPNAWALDDHGPFHVTGTFKPVSPLYPNVLLLDGATLDLSDETGVWSTTSQRASSKQLLMGRFACTFATNAAITVDVHGRTFAAGARVIAWATRPATDVTFQWDAATQAAHPDVTPFVAADGLYFGNPATVVSAATWTGAANDGDLANPANWSCTNPAGETLADGLPTAMTTVRFAGTTAPDIPVGSSFACAALEVGDLTLARDCDWRGFTGTLTITGTIDLQGHCLYLASAPQGFGSVITSSYGFDAANTAPTLVGDEACFWLDAADTATLTWNDDGRVTGWRSKGTVADVTAAPTNALTGPTWAPYDYARPCVDFGAASSQLDLVYPRFTKLRTVFWAVKIAKSGWTGFLLGDSERYDFHRGSGSQYGDAKYAKFATVWNGTDVIENWSGTVIPDDDFQIISVTTGEDCWSNSLTQDRVDPTRTGGRQLCELICFERLLTDAERTEVTQYLQRKWGGSVGANGLGELHLTVPADMTYLNCETKFTGCLKFVKEGAGTFIAGASGQCYWGDTEIAAGLATTPVSPTWDTERFSALNTRAYGLGTNLVVASGATFDIAGNYTHGIWKIVLDGGTLANSGLAMQNGWRSVKDVDVTADARVVCTGQTTFRYDTLVNFVTLNGHTLTFELDAPLYPWYSVFTNGTVRLAGAGALTCNVARDWRTVDLVVAAPLSIGADLAVRNYTAAYTNDQNAGTAALKVLGTFTPATDFFYGCELQDGATLDLSARTTVFNTVSAFTAGRNEMTFASDASVTVDIHGRTPSVGERLIAWTTLPQGVTFAWDAASATSATAQAPVVRADGLYFGGEEDLTVVDAVWTGAAGTRDALDPANWTCRNAAGAIVPNGLPGASTTAHLAGALQVDFPKGTTFTCQTLDIGEIKLTGDCDWRGLTISTVTKIDLDGHKLYLSELPASGTVTCAWIGDGENVGTEPELLNEACLWFDAAQKSTLTLNAANEVQSWTSRDASHTVATLSGNAPAYNTTLWDGRPTVDFGAVSSRKDLEFSRVTNMRTVFFVTKMVCDMRVFLLADSTTYHFHRGDGGQYASTQWSNIAKAWNGTTSVNPGSTKIPADAFQFIAVEMKSSSAANRICRDRNGTDRTGGKQVSEILAFPRVLTDAERTTVTEYLQNKWLYGSCHRGELHLDVPAGKTVVNNGLVMEKSVRFVKEGEGTYVANCAGQSYMGGNDVTGGTVRPRQIGTKYVLGGIWNEMRLAAGTVFDCDGKEAYTLIKFILDGGTIRNTGADLNNTTALGKIRLTADAQLEATRSLSVWWDQHLLDLGGHTLHVSISLGKYFTVGANTTTMQDGTLDIASGGWFRVYHGALDASTVNLRLGAALDIDNAAGTLTVHDYEARYSANYNAGTNLVKVLGSFLPAAGAYFHGCELADGATLDLSEQEGTFGVKGAFTTGANEMSFAADATAIQVVFGDRPIPSKGKIVDWTDRTPANLDTLKFTLDAASRSRGRRLVVRQDGLYLQTGMTILIR